MFRHIIFAVLVSLVVVLAAPASQMVTELDDITFWKFLDDHHNGRVFVKFYAPWCGHCKKLAPVWDDIASTNEEPDVAYAKIDCTKSKYVCKAFGVRSFPTLKIIAPSTGMMAEHTGGRDHAILQYSAKHVTPRTPLPARTPIPGWSDWFEDHFLALQKDLLDVWRFRKNIMFLVFIFGFALGYIVNNVCGGAAPRVTTTTANTGMDAKKVN